VGKIKEHLNIRSSLLMGTADIFWIDFFPAIGIRTDCLFENYLYKKHIQDSPSADAQQHIMLPLMYAENEGRREKFRDSMGTLQDGNGFEAIDYQHGHGRKRQDRAEVINNFRSLFPRRKEQKGERPGQDGDESDNQKCD
jgi:hypothetical protein